MAGDAVVERIRIILEGQAAPYEAAMRQAAAVTATETRKMQTALAGLARPVAGFGGVAQRAGTQIAGLTTHLDLGGGAMQMAAREAVMLSAALGPWGLIIGGGVAALAALAAELDIFDRGARTAAERTEAFQKAMKAAKDEAGLYKTAIDRLNEVLRTSKENSDANAAAKAQEALDIALGTLAVKERTLAELEAIATQARSNAEKFAVMQDEVSAKMERELAESFAGEIGVLKTEIDALESRILKLSFGPTGRERDAMDDGRSGGGAGGRGEDARLIDGQASSLAQLISKMREENQLLTLTAEQRQIELALRQATDAAMAEGNLLTQEQIALVTQLAQQHVSLSNAQRQAALDAQALERAQTQAAQQSAAAWQQAAGAIGSALQGALSGLLEGDFDWGRLVTGLIGTLGNAAMGGLTSGAFMAAGGPAHAGVPYTVGESGPERFVPNVEGHIMPHTQSAAAPASVAYIDARGADQAAIARLEAGMRDMQVQMRRRSVGSVMDRAWRTAGGVESLGG